MGDPGEDPAVRLLGVARDALEDNMRVGARLRTIIAQLEVELDDEGARPQPAVD